MKILSVDQIRKADEVTIIQEPIASIDLMERAASKIFNRLIELFPEETFQVVCGMGNNGGDGLVLARLLAEEGLDVKVSIVQFAGTGSSDFEQNLERLRSTRCLVEFLKDGDIPRFSEGILVDAIFGSGLTRPIGGWIANVVNQMNASSALTVSIDIPSGLFADESPTAESAIVEAQLTFTFQCPKLTFMHPENQKYVGLFEVLDIGLDQQFIQELDTDYHFVELDFVRPLLKEIHNTDHKGVNGKALLVAGSKGKMGAAILAARGALRSGVGLLTCHIPEIGLDIMQAAVPEAMVSTDKNTDYLSKAFGINGFDSLGIGPGISSEPDTLTALTEYLQCADSSVVLDADALNLLAQNKSLLKDVPSGSILTPHPGEFGRLIGEYENSTQSMKLQQAFCEEHQVVVVLKGGYSRVCTPEGRFFFNSTGNPGMATGGSGDVLTGVITSLLAQGYTPEVAAILGVFVHGLAGDLANQEKGFEGLIAGDIVEYLPDAFLQLRTY